MAFNLFKLVGSVYVDTDEANKSLSKTDSKAEGIGQKFSKGVGLAAKWGLAIGAAGVAGATAIYKLSEKAAAATDNIDKMSVRLGISREAYQELDFVLSQAGSSIDSFSMGTKTLLQRMDGVKNGNSNAISSFKALGIEVMNTDGSLKTQEEVLKESIIAFQNMESSSEKARLAQELFGRQGQEIMPLLDSEAGSFEEASKKARELGLVLSDETIDAGVQLTDTLDQMKRGLSAVGTKIGVALMPMIQTFSEWVIANMPTIQAVIQTAGKFIGGIINGGWNLIKTLFEFVKKTLNENGITVASAVKVIQSIWENNLKPVFNAIIDLVKAVAPVFQKVFSGIILPVIKNVFKGIGTIWNNVLQPIFTGIMKFLTGVFTGNWKKAFEGLKNIVSGAFSGLINIVKAPLNGVIAILNAFIRGLNKIKIPDWIPAIGGKGVNIKTIPFLWQGGDIASAGKAVVGDRGPEILDLPRGARVTPLSKANLDIPSGDLSVVVKLLELILEALKGGLYLDGDVLVGGLAERINVALGNLKIADERGVI